MLKPMTKEMMKEILNGYTINSYLCIEGCKKLEMVSKLTTDNEKNKLEYYTIFIVYVNDKVDFINENAEIALDYYMKTPN